MSFWETIFQRGAPYRIALSWGDDSNFESHILLDNIPHNDQWLDRPATHWVDIDIPDVDCMAVNCSLQLTQIAELPCAFDGIIDSCQGSDNVFFSCANVHIAGSTPAEHLPKIYVPFDYQASGPPEEYVASDGTGFWVNESRTTFTLVRPTSPSDTSKSDDSGITILGITLTFWNIVLFIAISSLLTAGCCLYAKREKKGEALLDDDMVNGDLGSYQPPPRSDAIL